MKWLFLVHHMQTPNSRERVKVWRLTKKVGAILYHNSVYVLPYNHERLEDFQWLCQQIKDSKGQASVFISESSDLHESAYITALFEQARMAEYEAILKSAENLLPRIQKSKSLPISASMLKQFRKDIKSLWDGFHNVQKIDFFDNPISKNVEEMLDRIQSEFFSNRSESPSSSAVSTHSTREFQSRTWATRRHIHIDRICSAWLIRRFIDPKASFVFAEEATFPKKAVCFDVAGAEFSHHGEYCTYETMLHSFQIADLALHEISEIVHDIDLKDQKFNRPEAVGIDSIMRSLSDLFNDDRKMLEIGSILLDALYKKFSTELKIPKGTG